MEQAKISHAELCDGYASSARIDFDNGDCLLLYGETELTYFMVQAFNFKNGNYNSCDTEEIKKVLDYVADVINDDHNETHALYRGDIKIYLNFSRIKGKYKIQDHLS